MRITLILLALGFLIVSRAEAQTMGHGHGTSITIDYNNLTFRYDFQDSDFKDTSSWNPETEESPLSVQKAADIARVNLQRFVSDAEKFEIEEIKLERFESHKWLFQISFHCWDKQCSDTSVSFPIFLKPNGSVIEPKVTPNEKVTNGDGRGLDQYEALIEARNPTSCCT